MCPPSTQVLTRPKSRAILTERSNLAHPANENTPEKAAMLSQTVFSSQKDRHKKVAHRHVPLPAKQGHQKEIKQDTRFNSFIDN
jgi:hypothetical protein